MKKQNKNKENWAQSVKLGSLQILMIEENEKTSIEFCRRWFVF